MYEKFWDRGDIIHIMDNNYGHHLAEVFVEDNWADLLDQGMGREAGIILAAGRLYERLCPRNAAIVPRLQERANCAWENILFNYLYDGEYYVVPGMDGLYGVRKGVDLPDEVWETI